MYEGWRFLLHFLDCADVIFASFAVIVLGQAAIILAARKHYTVDIVVGIYISLLVYYFVATSFPNKEPLPDPTQGKVVTLKLNRVRVMR